MARTWKWARPTRSNSTPSSTSPARRWRADSVPGGRSGGLDVRTVTGSRRARRRGSDILDQCRFRSEERRVGKVGRYEGEKAEVEKRGGRARQGVHRGGVETTWW